MSEKLLNKILKKVEQIEKMHDKESILCEEVKDLIEEIKELNNDEDIEQFPELDHFENLDDEDIDEEEDK